MPELPDVEVRRVYLEQKCIGNTVSRVSVTDARILDNVSPSSLGRGLRSAKLLKAGRRGKYLLVATSLDNTLLMHLGMTGDLYFRERGRPKPSWSRVEFYFRDGTCLHYQSKRLLGRVALYPTTEESRIPDVAKLGPEPLDVSFDYGSFKKIASGHRVTVHQLLMDQNLIAGIGNIYSDEITFQAGIRPDRNVGEMGEAEFRRIYEKMKWTLGRAIELGAELEDYPDQFLEPHRKRGGQCPRSGDRLEYKKIGGRTSYFCPRCQK